LIRPHCGCALVYLLIFTASFLLVVLTPMGKALLSSGSSTLFVVAPPLLICGSRIGAVHRVMKDDVVETRGLVCPRCLYDLSAAGSVSACPECGQSVDLKKLPRQWARTVRALRYPDGDREAVRGWLDV
jgi:DNA-directed RNA polymerase subunit RPC12/RpoP